MKNKRALIAIPFILAAMAFILIFGALQQERILSIFPAAWISNHFIDLKLKYQVASMIVAFLLLAIIAFLTPKNARLFYRKGKITAPAEPVKWLGIKEKDTWRSVGVIFSVIVTIATAIFIYFNVAKGQSLQAENAKFLPFILLFSLMNSFTEEAVTRLALGTSLYGLVKAPIIHIASALLFGIPHYFGTPGGFLGAIMAGFLGWLLSKSVIETKGFFWAWFIHFLQDVVIISGLFLVAL